MAVHGYSLLQRQTVNNFPATTQIQKQIREIIQEYLGEVKNNVGDGFQVVQHIIAVNQVTSTKLQMQCCMLKGPIMKIGRHPTVKLFFRKIITDPGINAQQAITGKNTVILELLPIGNSMHCRYSSKEKD
jgi:hypothetical protein